MRNFLPTLLFLLASLSLSGQNTIGVINSIEGVSQGYVLFSSGTKTFLIDNCGQQINSWKSDYKTGHAAYLLDDGSLIRAGKIDHPTIQLGGIGGIIEKWDWDGNLIWSYTYSNGIASQHHDFAVLPSGNVLILVVEINSKEEAIISGRDPSLITNDQVYTEKILEIQPQGADGGVIVWEWDMWDHLIQDFDQNKDNYGQVNEHPELLNINYLGDFPANPDWIHANSLQYNTQLDQILLGSQKLNEFYIIDHSTSTAEASGHTGGVRGKGGDILYRWGNQASYLSSPITSKKLYGPHFPNWIPSDLLDGDKIIVFNNGLGRDTSFSQIEIINPAIDNQGNYVLTDETYFGPLGSDLVYQNENELTDFYSRILSGAQRLPNGNTLICEGTKGKIFEINSSQDIVWEYINPTSASDEIFSQGTEPNTNSLFRALKYSPAYPAFRNKSLIPSKPIELNPNLGECSDIEDEPELEELVIFPNPVMEELNYSFDETFKQALVFDIQGRVVKSFQENEPLEVSDLISGLYYIRFSFRGSSESRIFIKE